MRKLLIANRAEVALRVQRAAQEMGLAFVQAHDADDVASWPVRRADEAAALRGHGPAAYLDGMALIAAARRHGCDAVHPGWGFLSERADFAQACAEAGLVFVGSTPEQLALFGDKAMAREFAAARGVPVLPGSGVLADVEAARAFQARHGAIVIKAVVGGGGRGMRILHAAHEVDEAFSRSRAEALAAFGAGDLYAERLIERARHLEVQVAGDGAQVVVLGDRDCTLQRRFQKLVEIAPAPGLDEAGRAQLHAYARRMAQAAELCGLATFEFLQDLDAPDSGPVFIEANPRLQVEHTVTETVTGLDLVQLQLRLADGDTLAAQGLRAGAVPATRGVAVQWRVNAERMDEDGAPRPSGGTLVRADWPQGPGVRVDTWVQAGDAPSPLHDTLLAKIVVHHPSGDLADAMRRARRALAECRLEGVATNLTLLAALAAEPDLACHDIHTAWLATAWPRLRAACEVASEANLRDDKLPAGVFTLRAPMAGRVLKVGVGIGDALAAGATPVLIEAMKMEHALPCARAARVLGLHVAAGDNVAEGQVLMRLASLRDAEHGTGVAPPAVDLDAPRADLQRLRERHALTRDAARPEAMQRRHAGGGRSARENVADLVDAGSFDEYGALAIAAQTLRRPRAELERQTPHDGLVAGIGSVNGALFGPERARCVVLAYDYTVLAGTQGLRNHQKLDRMLELAHRLARPVVLFAEGGGGRPGDVDAAVTAGLNVPSFRRFAALSGRVPLLGIAHGRCFAGNAALLGCCDIVVATRGANIGLGGPAMIEGGGLGRVAPEAIGPAPELHRRGVVDLLVADEAEAVAAAKRLLACLQGRTADWRAGDPRRLRHAIPEQRRRSHDMRALLAALADEGSVIELRAGWGAGMITALARIEGRPLGVIANQPQHLGGAIDADAADKAARFMHMCSAHGLPLLSLVDTPGFMVGPESELQAHVRHASRMFVAAAHLRVPNFAVVVRRGFGLGAMAMAAGGFDAPQFTVAWPGAEFGAMGLEGAVRLGFRKELEAVPDGPERQALFDRLLAGQVEAGSALRMASTLEIDAVIDPADTRGWIVRGLEGTAAVGAPYEGAPRFVDPW